MWFCHSLQSGRIPQGARRERNCPLPRQPLPHHHAAKVSPQCLRAVLPAVPVWWLAATLVCSPLAAQLADSVDPQSLTVDPQSLTVDPQSLTEAPRAEQQAGTGIAVEDILASIDRGIDFLLQSQNKDGSWGQPTRTKDLNIYAPVPGAHHAFRTAVTALCVSSLCEQESRRSDVTQALDRGQEWLIANLPQLRRATGDAIYNVWGHGYSISAMVALYQRTENEQLRNQLAELIQMQFDRLSDYESVDGGWGYYDFDVKARRPAASSTSFVNATVLVALHHAASIGLQPPESLVRRAVAATLRQRKSDFTYLYGEYLKYQPALGINRPGGSLGRSQACNIALRYWGDSAVSDAVLTEWLDRLILRHGWLDMGRKRPIPHEAWMQVAGYFFYYGHYYAALCLQQLSQEEKSRLAPQLAALLVERQETDGSWWDYPLYNYHPPYGTAFVLMSLQRYHQAMSP